MRPQSRHLAGVALAVLLGGCGRGNPDTVQDTTGAMFGWHCTEDDGCEITEISETPPPASCGESEVFYAYIASRLVHICSAASTPESSRFWTTEHSLCRPMKCASDDACPIWEERPYACVSGLCQLPEVALDGLDVVGLCLADTPRGNDCATAFNDPKAQQAQALAEASCDASGQQCAVPTECQQP